MPMVSEVNKISRQPFGYSNWRRPDPTEAAAIKSAAFNLLSGRITLHDVAAEWNRAGLLRRRSPDRPWDVAAAYQALTSDHIAGVVRRGGAVLDEAPDWVPILTTTQQQGLLSPLRDQDLRQQFGFNGRHLARGIATCGVCGAGLEHQGSGVRARYICTTQAPYGRQTAPRDGRQHVQVADHKVDGALRAAVLALLSENGLRLVGYTPRPLADLAKAIGAAKAVVSKSKREFEADSPLRLREAEHDLAVLEAERDDRLLYEALLRVDEDDLEQSWDAASLLVRHTILRRTITASVEPGRALDRVRIDRLLD